MYASPTADHPAEIRKIMTLAYSVVIPYLNPMIYSLQTILWFLFRSYKSFAFYSLQTKEMTAALKKVLRTE